MAISAYTKTTWAKSPSTTSAISAPNLQHLEDQVKDITDAAVSGGASPTKIWTSTNDGNGGVAPSPKTYMQQATKAQNEYFAITTATGGWYLVAAWNASSGGEGAVSIMCNSGGTLYLVASLKTSANVSIDKSGADVRAINLNAASSSIRCVVTQIGW